MARLKEIKFEGLQGKIFVSIERQDEEVCDGRYFSGGIITFKTIDETFIMGHSSDCCEHVSVEDINGSLDDLIGVPILRATVAESGDVKLEYGDLGMWTFYHFRTAKGDVTIRWYGSSNGYYSVSVSIYRKEE